MPCLDASLPPGGAWCARAGLTYLQRGRDDLLRESDDNCASGITPAWKKQSQQVSNGFSTRESHRPLEVTGSTVSSLGFVVGGVSVSPSFRRSSRLLRPAPSHEHPSWDRGRPRVQGDRVDRPNPNVESVATSNVDVVRPATTSTTPRRQHRHRYANVPCAVPSGNRRSTSCGSCLSSAHRFRHMFVCFGLERAGGRRRKRSRAPRCLSLVGHKFPRLLLRHRWWSAAVEAGPCIGPPLAVILRRNIDNLQPYPSSSTRARMHGGHAVHHPRQPPSPLAGTDAS